MRKSWLQYFMDMAFLASERSTCMRRKVGAIVEKEHRVLTTGYNGIPAKYKHCDQRGCFREENGIPSGTELGLCYANHAEANAVAQAAMFGTSLAGATLFCTTKPCFTCLKLIISSGIDLVFFKENYPDKWTDKFINEDIQHRLIGRNPIKYIEEEEMNVLVLNDKYTWYLDNDRRNKCLL